jgi:hypothetical protein
MEIYVDNFSEKLTKNNVKYVNFNVLFVEGESIIYTQGWQMFQGLINPPSFARGRRFFPILNLSPAAARTLYEKVGEKLPAGYDLSDMDEVTQNLELRAPEYKRLFPNL